MLIKKKEDLEDENFSLKKYVEQELADLIKPETVKSTGPYLESLIEALELKKGALKNQKQISAKLNSDENRKIKAHRSNTKIHEFEKAYSEIFEQLSSTEAKLREDVKMSKALKKKLDKIWVEKDKINSELFVLDLIRDMKVNEGSFERIKTFEDKIKFAKNIEEIRNQITMFEKAVVPKFEKLQNGIEQEFIETLNKEIDSKRFAFAPAIIEYFKKVSKEDLVFEIICTHFVLRINFDNVPNSFNKQNLDNISFMLNNFFELIDKFYDRRFYDENNLLTQFDEDLFNKFTGFFFEKSLGRYLDVVLMKNLKSSNHQFFLDYLERLHEIFEGSANKFEQVKAYSIFLHELLYAYKSAAMAKYYEVYFSIEEKNFIYKHDIYIKFLKELLISNFGSKRPKQFEEILGLLKNEKFDEYFDFIKRSISRAAVLCDSAFLAFNLTKLIKYSLENFEGFFSFIITNLKSLVSPASQEKTLISPESFRIAEMMYIYMLRMNIDQKRNIENVRFSIYFSEINLFRKGVLDNLKKQLEEFVNRCVSNILDNVSMSLKVALPSNSKHSVENNGVILQVKKFIAPYVAVIHEYTNPEFKITVEVIFFRSIIQLIELQFLNMDLKLRDKFNFQNELAPFFELFKPVEHPELIRDINSLRYLLLFLKAKEKDIYQLVEPAHKDLVNAYKLEMYQVELNKKTKGQ